MLVLIDPQRGFFEPAVPENLAIRLRGLLSRKLFRAVIATKFVSEPRSPFQRFMGWNGLHGAEEDICEEIVPWLDVIVAKSGFNGATTSVLRVLRELNGGRRPQHVYLAGTDTEACVLATSMGFFEKNIRPVVLADYCASSGGVNVHKAGLLCLERAIGAMNVVYGDPCADMPPTKAP